MRIEEVKISPAMAREWLAVGPERPRRTIRHSTLHKLRHALEAGEWKLTHQPIALERGTGFVLDGRHRLTVIAEQRRHIPSLVAFDAEPDTYAVIDTGTARSPGDALRTAGYANVNVLSAAARQTHAYPLVVGTADTLDSKTGRMTSSEILTIVGDPEIGKTVQDSVTPGTRIANEVGRYGWKTNAVALLSVIALYSDHGEDTQHEFADSLGTGANLDPHSPILAFRRWLILSSGFEAHRHHYRRTAAMALGIQAWNDYAAGRERQAQRFTPGTTRMPEVE